MAARGRFSNPSGASGVSPVHAWLFVTGVYAAAALFFPQRFVARLRVHRDCRTALPAGIAAARERSLALQGDEK